MIGRLCLVLAVLPSVAWAEEDYMEVQRCVWRCLADSPGADSTEYNQCVAAKCNEPAAASPAPRVAVPAPALVPALAGPPWTYGLTQDGRGYFAGQVALETGNVLYYTCEPTGAQNLILAGEVEGPAAVLNLDIDGQVLGLWFEPTPGGYTSRLEQASPVPGLIGSARRLQVRNEVGWPFGTFPMTGAGAAINASRAACGF